MLLNMASAGDPLLASSFRRGGPIRGVSQRGLAIDGTRWHSSVGDKVNV